MSRELYNVDELKVMRLAEEALERGASRLVEKRNFALKSGYKKIGLAHCMAVSKEAAVVKEFLSNDFEVFSIDCKIGKLPKSEFLGDGAVGISCNPMGQAEYLTANGSEMNIVMGLCVGHDMVFGMNSKVPTTTLLVKDRVHKHNPIEGIKNIGEKAL